MKKYIIAFVLTMALLASVGAYAKKRNHGYDDPFPPCPPCAV